jgi:hypothetical protein
LKKSLLTWIICLLSLSISAQAPENIASDRPGNAFSALTVGKKVFQAQVGTDYGGSRVNNRTSSDYNFLSTFIRYGLWESVEISAQADYRYDRFRQLANINGISNLGIGLRYNVLRSSNGGPDIGALLTVNFSNILSSYETRNEIPTLIVSVQQALPYNFSLTANFGGSLVDPNRDFQGIYVLNLGYGITEELSAFIESYGTFDSRNFIRNYDAGLGYLANKDIQIDIYGGAADYRNELSYFVSVGISIRVGKTEP